MELTIYSGNTPLGVFFWATDSQMDQQVMDPAVVGVEGAGVVDVE